MEEGEPPHGRPHPDAERPDEPPPRSPDGPAAPDLHALARDWIAIWQSELAAAAADRELQEGWQRLVALWAGAATAMLQTLPRGVGDAPRPCTRPPDAARPAPAVAASDPRDAEIERLARRIDELERRLADLDANSRGKRGGGGNRRRARQG